MEKINLRYYRHFLICNRIASETLKKREGIYIANFAKLIFQESNGVWGNAQMTAYFWAANTAIAYFSEVDSGYYVFDALDDMGYSLESLANISEAELESEYRKVQLTHVPISE